jgi:hypothetical protein
MSSGTSAALKGPVRQEGGSDATNKVLGRLATRSPSAASTAPNISRIATR